MLMSWWLFQPPGQKRRFIAASPQGLATVPGLPSFSRDAKRIASAALRFASRLNKPPENLAEPFTALHTQKSN
jgi:hypothetical protein